MRAGWESGRLGDVLTRTETVNPDLKPNEYFDYIDVSSVSNKTFQIEETQRLMGKDAPSRARRGVRENDIVFATIRPTLRRIAIVPSALDKQVCSTGYFVMRPGEKVDHRFLFYYLFTDHFMGQMEILQKGASYPAVTDAEVRSQEISFPSIPEQQRIVAILDEAFDCIATAKANSEKNLLNARDVFESYLDVVFNHECDHWSILRLDALTEPDSPITYGVVKPGPEGEIRFIRGGDLVRGKVRLEQLRTITRSVSDQYRRTLLRGGELLICLVGQPGQVAVAPPEIVGANIARQVGLIRLKKTMEPEFVRYFLQSPQGAKALGARETGSVQQVINLGELRHLLVPHPQLDEQRSIVEKLYTIYEETIRLESIYCQKNAALEELKQSLLNRAFNGDL